MAPPSSAAEVPIASQPPPAGTELIAAGPLLVLGLWVANDHLFKGAGLLPGWLTGKLSDVTGLFCFPLVLVALARLLFRPASAASPRRWIAVAAAVSAAIFATVKVFPPLAAALSLLWGPVRPDATDLLALPAAALSVLWYRRWLSRPPRFSPPMVARLAVLLVGLWATAATQPLPAVVRPLPIWARAEQTTLPIGCATVDVWVSKSGKQGLGLTLQIQSNGAACALRLDRAQLRVARQVSAATVTLPITLATRQAEPGWQYLPFPFDNDRAWRNGDRQAVVELEFVSLAVPGAAPAAVRWLLPLVQRLPPDYPARWPTYPGARTFDAGAGADADVGAAERAR